MNSQNDQTQPDDVRLVLERFGMPSKVVIFSDDIKKYQKHQRSKSKTLRSRV
jgi:hypothetical protein